MISTMTIRRLKTRSVSAKAASAKSMTGSAATEPEDIFIRIFDPIKDPGTAAAYVTTGNIVR